MVYGTLRRVMTSITSTRAARVGLVTAGVVIAAAALSSHSQSSEHTCFPTCATDGRFLVLTGNDPTTLAASQVVIGLNFPPTGNRGDFDLFDGDRDATRWDVRNPPSNANPPQLEIELYEDAAGAGTGGTLVKKWAAGEIDFQNSAWTGVTWPHAPGALSPAGADQMYRYALKITPASPAEDLGWNAFKIRTHGTIHLPPQVFGFIGSLVVPGDLPSIYPGYPNLTGSSYDGSWSFKFRVPAGVDSVTIFDGDMDYGDAACTISDTDDRDSTGVPAFGSGAVAEGVAATGLPCSGGKGSRTGLPAEDNAGAAFKRVPSKSGTDAKGILYRVIAPDGQTFANRNPSGNREWEQFKIAKVATAPATACPPKGFAGHDCETANLPEGLWEIQIDGMDLSNLNFFFLNFRIER
jgi:hypothetical protein